MPIYHLPYIYPLIPIEQRSGILRFYFVHYLMDRKNSVGEREYYVKWNELTYEECTWENESDISAFQPEIERFNEIQSRRKKSGDKGKATREPRQFKEQSPPFLSGGMCYE